MIETVWICKELQENPIIIDVRSVKKPSRLKRGVYRAADIGRQSRPLGKNEGVYFLKISGLSIRALVRCWAQ